MEVTLYEYFIAETIAGTVITIDSVDTNVSNIDWR